MTYTVLLTFLLLTSSGTKEMSIRCPNWACVERIMAHTHESRALARLRVYEGNPVILPSGNAVFPPLIDYALQ